MYKIKKQNMSNIRKFLLSFFFVAMIFSALFAVTNKVDAMTDPSNNFSRFYINGSYDYSYTTSLPDIKPGTALQIGLNTRYDLYDKGIKELVFYYGCSSYGEPSSHTSSGYLTRLYTIDNDYSYSFTKSMPSGMLGNCKIWVYALNDYHKSIRNNVIYSYKYYSYVANTANFKVDTTTQQTSVKDIEIATRPGSYVTTQQVGDTYKATLKGLVMKPYSLSGDTIRTYFRYGTSPSSLIPGAYGSVSNLSNIEFKGDTHSDLKAGTKYYYTACGYYQSNANTKDCGDSLQNFTTPGGETKSTYYYCSGSYCDSIYDTLSNCRKLHTTCWTTSCGGNCTAKTVIVKTSGTGLNSDQTKVTLYGSLESMGGNQSLSTGFYVWNYGLSFRTDKSYYAGTKYSTQSFSKTVSDLSAGTYLARAYAGGIFASVVYDRKFEIKGVQASTGGYNCVSGKCTSVDSNAQYQGSSAYNTCYANCKTSTAKPELVLSSANVSGTNLILTGQLKYNGYSSSKVANVFAYVNSVSAGLADPYNNYGDISKTFDISKYSAGTYNVSLMANTTDYGNIQSNPQYFTIKGSTETKAYHSYCDSHNECTSFYSTAEECKTLNGGYTCYADGTCNGQYDNACIKQQTSVKTPGYSYTTQCITVIDNAQYPIKDYNNSYSQAKTACENDHKTPEPTKTPGYSCSPTYQCVGKSDYAQYTISKYGSVSGAQKACNANCIKPVQITPLIWTQPQLQQYYSQTQKAVLKGKFTGGDLNKLYSVHAAFKGEGENARASSPVNVKSGQDIFITIPGSYDFNKTLTANKKYAYYFVVEGKSSPQNGFTTEGATQTSLVKKFDIKLNKITYVDDSIRNSINLDSTLLVDKKNKDKVDMWFEINKKEVDTTGDSEYKNFPGTGGYNFIATDKTTYPVKIGNTLSIRACANLTATWDWLKKIECTIPTLFYPEAPEEEEEENLTPLLVFLEDAILSADGKEVTVTATAWSKEYTGDVNWQLLQLATDDTDWKPISNGKGKLVKEDGTTNYYIRFGATVPFNADKQVCFLAKATKTLNEWQVSKETMCLPEVPWVVTGRKIDGAATDPYYIDDTDGSLFYTFGRITNFAGNDTQGLKSYFEIYPKGKYANKFTVLADVPNGIVKPNDTLGKSRRGEFSSKEVDIESHFGGSIPDSAWQNTCFKACVDNPDPNADEKLKVVCGSEWCMNLFSVGLKLDWGGDGISITSPQVSDHLSSNEAYIRYQWQVDTNGKTYDLDQKFDWYIVDKNGDETNVDEIISRTKAFGPNANKATGVDIQFKNDPELKVELLNKEKSICVTPTLNIAGEPTDYFGQEQCYPAIEVKEDGCNVKDEGTDGLKLCVPNGGEAYVEGKVMNIKWESQGTGQITIGLLPTQGGLEYIGTVGNTGEYNWNISVKNKSDTSKYKVIVLSNYNSSTGIVDSQDISDDWFTITNLEVPEDTGKDSPLHFTNPENGSSIKSGDTLILKYKGTYPDPVTEWNGGHGNMPEQEYKRPTKACLIQESTGWGSSTGKRANVACFAPGVDHENLHAVNGKGIDVMRVETNILAKYIDISSSEQEVRYDLDFSSDQILADKANEYISKGWKCYIQMTMFVYDEDTGKCHTDGWYDAIRFNITDFGDGKVSSIDINITSPTSNEKFIQGQNNIVSWTGGKDSVKLLLASKITTNPYNGGIKGYLSSENYNPNSSMTWNGKQYINNAGNKIDVEVGEYKIIAYSVNADGKMGIGEGQNWDLSDTFTLDSTTEKKEVLSIIDKPIIIADSMKYNPQIKIVEYTAEIFVGDKNHEVKYWGELYTKDNNGKLVLVNSNFGEAITDVSKSKSITIKAYNLAIPSNSYCVNLKAKFNDVSGAPTGEANQIICDPGFWVITDGNNYPKNVTQTSADLGGAITRYSSESTYKVFFEYWPKGQENDKQPSKEITKTKGNVPDRFNDNVIFNFNTTPDQFCYRTCGYPVGNEKQKVCGGTDCEPLKRLDDATIKLDKSARALSGDDCEKAEVTLKIICEAEDGEVCKDVKVADQLHGDVDKYIVGTSYYKTPNGNEVQKEPGFNTGDMLAWILGDIDGGVHTIRFNVSFKNTSGQKQTNEAKSYAKYEFNGDIERLFFPKIDPITLISCESDDEIKTDKTAEALDGELCEKALITLEIECNSDNECEDVIVKEILTSEFKYITGSAQYKNPGSSYKDKTPDQINGQELIWELGDIKSGKHYIRLIVKFLDLDTLNQITNEPESGVEYSDGFVNFPEPNSIDPIKCDEEDDPEEDDVCIDIDKYVYSLPEDIDNDILNEAIQYFEDSNVSTGFPDKDYWNKAFNCQKALTLLRVECCMGGGEVDVMFIIDRSPSMTTPSNTGVIPIKEIKTAVGDFISKLGSKDQAGIVSFSLNNQMKLEHSLSSNLNSVKAAAGNIQEAGGRGTQFTTALEETIKEFQRNGRADVAKAVIFMTDGVPAPDPNGDEKKNAKILADTLKGKDIKFFVVGLNGSLGSGGVSYDKALLQAMASDPDSKYYHETTDPKNLAKIYKAIMEGGLNSGGGRCYDVTVSDRVASNMKIDESKIWSVSGQFGTNNSDKQLIISDQNSEGMFEPGEFRYYAFMTEFKGDPEGENQLMNSPREKCYANAKADPNSGTYYRDICDYPIRRDCNTCRTVVNKTAVEVETLEPTNVKVLHDSNSDKIQTKATLRGQWTNGEGAVSGKAYFALYRNGSTNPFATTNKIDVVPGDAFEKSPSWGGIEGEEYSYMAYLEATMSDGTVENAYGLKEDIREGEDRKEFKILSPKLEDVWYIGRKHTILWESPDSYDDDDIVEMWLFDARTGEEKIVSVIKLFGGNKGSYDINVSDDWDIGDKYIIKATLHSNPENGLKERHDSSDYFSIKDTISDFKVLSPNGGETWIPEQEYTIKWDTGNYSQDENISIIITDYSTGIKKVLATTKNTGSYSVYIDENEFSPVVFGKDEYKISIFAYNGSTIKDSDSSDHYFSIKDIIPDFKVLSPNGGETWTAGEEYSITWDKGKYPETYGVGLSLYNKRLDRGVRLINTKNSGQESIVLTRDIVDQLGGADNQFYVRALVWDNTGSQVRLKAHDISDDVFTIKTGEKFEVYYPNGGETWYTGNEYKVLWTPGDYPSDYKAVISLTNRGVTPVKGFQVGTLVNNKKEHTFSLTEFIVNTITNNKGEGNNFTIDIALKDRDGNQVDYDQSDKHFAIRKNAEDPNEPEVDLDNFLISPNGERNYIISDSMDIKWNEKVFDTQGSVYLILYANGHKEGKLLGVSTNDGIHIVSSLKSKMEHFEQFGSLDDMDFYVTAIVINNKKVRKDSSDKNFKITGKVLTGILKVVSPNGGEQFKRGSVEEIKWTGGKDKVWLRLFNGNSMLGEIRNESGKQLYSYSDGKMLWNVQDVWKKIDKKWQKRKIPFSTNYKVRISSVENYSVNYNNVDNSDNVFSVVEAEFEEDIDCYRGVKIYTNSNGNIQTNLNGSAFAYTSISEAKKHIDTLYTEGYTYTQCGEEDDADDDITCNVNDEGFDGMKLCEPNGGESYQLGDIMNIRWDDSGSEKIRLAIIGYNGMNTKARWIISNINNTGEYSWTISNIPESPTNDYKILIVSIDGKKMDVSDDMFKIGEQEEEEDIDCNIIDENNDGFKLCVPNKGNSKNVGQEYDLKWKTGLSSISKCDVVRKLFNEGKAQTGFHLIKDSNGILDMDNSGQNKFVITQDDIDHFKSIVTSDFDPGITKISKQEAYSPDLFRLSISASTGDNTNPNDPCGKKNYDNMDNVFEIKGDQIEMAFKLDDIKDWEKGGKNLVTWDNLYYKDKFDGPGNFDAEHRVEIICEFYDLNGKKIAGGMGITTPTGTVDYSKGKIEVECKGAQTLPETFKVRLLGYLLKFRADPWERIDYDYTNIITIRGKNDIPDDNTPDAEDEYNDGLTLDNPNGGDKYVQGTSNVIKWHGGSNENTYKVSIYKGSKPLGFLFLKNFTGTESTTWDAEHYYVKSTATGKYTKKNLPLGADYRIGVFGKNNGKKVFDFSDTTFSITDSSDTPDVDRDTPDIEDDGVDISNLSIGTLKPILDNTQSIFKAKIISTNFAKIGFITYPKGRDGSSLTWMDKSQTGIKSGEYSLTNSGTKFKGTNFCYKAFAEVNSQREYSNVEECFND